MFWILPFSELLAMPYFQPAEECNKEKNNITDNALDIVYTSLLNTGAPTKAPLLQLIFRVLLPIKSLW